MLVFAIGLLTGALLVLTAQIVIRPVVHSTSTATKYWMRKGSSSEITSSQAIINAADVPWTKTSHAGVGEKQQLVSAFSHHSNLAGISIGRMQPGERIVSHVHSDMHEYFFVLSGKVYFDLESNETSELCQGGLFVHAAPGVAHSLWVANDAVEEARFFYI
jgi:quercetin dioxygenase-like cupin family protein